MPMKGELPIRGLVADGSDQVQFTRGARRCGVRTWLGSNRTWRHCR
jgi:hypothetical protein